MGCSTECSEKRAAIMQATVELVSENGFHGTPMAMVAERAGVAAGTIYRYFESKEVLIAATYADLEDRMRKKCMEGFPEHGTPQEKFVHLARTLVEQWLASPIQLRFLEQFHNSPFGLALRRDKVLGKVNDLCRNIFNEALEKQAVKDLPISMLFALGLGPLIYICRDHNTGLLQLDESLLQQAIDGCWNAVKR